MCDQTEVVYSPGDVVWVKLGPIWWPGQVYDYEKLPEEITANLRKTPIAVVKFFQEDSYEYVKNLNSIYHYNCRRKHEFIKKGLDVIRSNNRDVPSNMKMFPNDVVTAEHLTHGNPEILDDEEFALKEKEDYSELFGKKTPKKNKVDSLKKDSFGWRKSLSDSSIKVNRRSLPTPIVPRPITHRRFITKALEGRSDHEVRIRQQASEKYADTPSKLYNCHLCGFSSSRINVIILHNKSHSAGYAEAYLHPQNLSVKTGRKSKGERKITFSGEKRQRVYDAGKSDEPVYKKKSIKLSKEASNETIETEKKLHESPTKNTTSRKPIFGKKRSAKDKAEKIAREKQQNDAFRDNLLKDWEEEDFGNSEDKTDDSLDPNNEKDGSRDSTLDSSELRSNRTTKQKETSCFDFDDSEDGLDIGETVMKFGQKIPRILGEKSKKHVNKTVRGKSPVMQGVSNENQESNIANETVNEFISNKKQGDVESVAVQENENEKSNEDLDKVFKSLLNETAVPVIPDAPTHLESKKLTSSVDQTSSVCGESVVSETNEEEIDDGGGGQTDEGGGNGNPEFDQDCLNEPKTSVSESVSKVNETLSDVQNRDETVSIKSTSFSDTEHFLVKTSEEVATSSSDDAQLEVVSSPNENNVASSNAKSIDENSVKKHTISEGENDLVAENVLEETAEDISLSVSSHQHDRVVFNKEPGVTDTLSKSIDEIENCNASETKNESLSSDTVNEPNAASESSCNQLEIKQESNNLQVMDFDINSMPVIIGDDMVEEEGSVLPMSDSKVVSHPQLTSVKTDIPMQPGNKLITVKTVPKQLAIDSAIATGNLPILVKEEVGYGSQPTTVGKESRLPTKKLIFSPTVAVSRAPQVATIKVQPSTAAAINKLTVPGSMIAQKGLGTTSQVLILKSTTPSGKSTLQKIGNTSQVIQQGGKVLILTNPQGVAGQNKIITQKNLSPSKLTGTRILTTKGTVLTTGAPAAIAKANLISGSGKTVTTKSGQKILINKGGIISQSQKSVIINKGGLLTAVNSPTVISSKAPLITQNILTSKPETITSQINLSHITAAGSSKCTTATNIITASGLTANNSMVLTPLTIGKNTTLTNSQKLKLITSKASPVATSSASGTKLIVQGAQSRVILPSSLQKPQQLKFVGNLKNQSNTGTILIQTSQGVIATTPLSSGQLVNKKSLKSTTPPILSAKSGSIQVTQAALQPQNKFVVQKVKPGPNILQRTQKKPAQRNSKKNVMPGQLLATSVPPQQNLQTTVQTPATISQSTLSSSQETLLLSSTSALPVIGQSSVVSGTQLDSTNQTALVYLTVDESGNYRPLETAPVVNFKGASADSQTLYIDSGTTDLDNIFLAIDDAGNVVNIARPVQNTFTTENSTPPPSQDILAKALADTQVLQQETIITENSHLGSNVSSSVLGGCMFVEQPAHYPQPTLSHGVLETSLTLNQPPIMTPLEVPSAVSPRNLNRISLQTGFLNDSGLLNTNKENKHDIHPSMPLLTEDVDCGTSKNETVYFTQVDGSHAVLTPVSSGSQLAFQLALDGNNVIVSSTPGLPSLGVISSSTIAQSAVGSATRSSSQMVTVTDSFKTLMSVNDTAPAVFSEVKEESSMIEHFQPIGDSDLADHGSSSTSNDESKNIDNQNLVYDTPIQESTPATTVSLVSEDNFPKSLNSVISKLEIEDTTSESLESHGNLCMISSDDSKISSVSLNEPAEMIIPDHYTEPDQAESHHMVSVINRPVHEFKEETVIVTEAEHYSSAIMDASFSNGEIQQGVAGKRLSTEDSAELIVPDISTDDGSDCKRIKLEES